MLTNSGCTKQATYREGRDHSRRVHGENKGGEGYVPGEVEKKGVEASFFISNHLGLR